MPASFKAVSLACTRAAKSGACGASELFSDFPWALSGAGLADRLRILSSPTAPMLTQVTALGGCRVYLQTWTPRALAYANAILISQLHGTVPSVAPPDPRTASATQYLDSERQEMVLRQCRVLPARTGHSPYPALERKVAAIKHHYSHGSPRTMLYLKVILREQIQPTTLLSYGFRHSL